MLNYILELCEEIEDPSNFLKAIFFKILREKYCPPDATVDLTEDDDDEDDQSSDNYEQPDSLRGMFLTFYFTI